MTKPVISFIAASVLAASPALAGDRQPTPTSFPYGSDTFEALDFYGAGPATNITVNPNTSELFWIEATASGPVISVLPLVGNHWDETQKRTLSSIQKGSFFDATPVASLNASFIVSDEGHNESFNVYRLDFATGAFAKISDTAYSPTYTYAESQQFFVMAARKVKTIEDSCLQELSLDGQRTTELFCDDEQWKLYGYNEPIISDDGRYIVATVMIGLNRHKLNLVVYDRHTKEHWVITNAAHTRSQALPIAIRNDEILYVSNENEQTNSLWSIPLAGGTAKKLIHHQRANFDAKLLKNDGLILTHSFDGNAGEFSLYDTQSMEAIIQNIPDQGHRPITSNRLIEAGTKKYATPGTDGISRNLGAFLINVSEEAIAANQVVTFAFRPKKSDLLAKPCESEDISYETFDIDPETNSKRLIHGILYKPKRSNAKEAAAFVYAHGGPTSSVSRTSINSSIEFLCTLGYTVVSANVRGSSGRGQAFMDLNNYDWGGGDYLDYDHARKYLIDKVGIPAHRIGITGISYGGFMTNWIMTRPDNQFAVGISQCGMTDLVNQVRSSVIPANQVSELGTPEENPEFYRERSPLFYADSMNKPLLLIHGGNDVRVPVEESRRFYQALISADRPAQYLELPGEGHALLYLDSNIKAMKTKAQFLWEHLPLETRLK